MKPYVNHLIGGYVIAVHSQGVQCEQCVLLREQLDAERVLAMVTVNQVVALTGELASTRAELTSTRAELTSTKAELASTKAELATTTAHFMELIRGLEAELKLLRVEFRIQAPRPRTPERTNDIRSPQKARKHPKSTGDVSYSAAITS